MAFSEFETKRYQRLAEQYVEGRRPPAHLRNQVDIAWRLVRQSLEFFEIRPAMNNPQISLEHPIVKTTYVRKTNVWKIYWMRADLKWHSYEPFPTAGSLEEVFEIVEKDEYGCFYG